MGKLTPKQGRFVQEYLVDLNATQAAIRAGYSPATAHVTASQYLAKPNIAAAIAEKQAEIAKRNDVTVDRIVQELAAIAFTRLDEVAPWNEYGPHLIDSAELDRRPKASIKKLSVKRSHRPGSEKGDEGYIVEDWSIEQHSKLDALEKLGRHIGMFKEAKQTLVPAKSSPLDELRKRREAMAS